MQHLDGLILEAETAGGKRVIRNVLCVFLTLFYPNRPDYKPISEVPA